MILDRLFQYSSELIRYQKIIKIGLVVAPLFMLKIRRASTGVISSEPTHSYQRSSIKINGSARDGELLFNNNRFVLNKLPPRSSLRIQGQLEQKEYFYPLISALKRMEIKNMNVIVDLNPPDRRYVYLFEMTLSFGDSMCMWIHPLRNYQPNSDLLLVAKEFFTPEVALDPIDFILTNSPSNHLEISLRYSREDLKVFMKFMKAVSFIRSHPYGTYFYIPLKDSYVEATIFLPTIVLVLGYYIFDWFCARYPVSLVRIFLGSFFYLFSPLSALLFLRRNEVQCLLAVFMALNFKFGLFYLGICYLRMIHDAAGIIASVLRTYLKSTKFQHPGEPSSKNQL